MLTLLGLTALVLVLLLIAIGFWWNGVQSQRAAKAPTARAVTPPQPAATALVPVAVVTARRVPQVETVSIPATWQTDKARHIIAPLAGVLQRLTVRPGERVTAGQTVALLTTTRRVAQVPRPRQSATARPSSRIYAGSRQIQTAARRLARAQEAAGAVQAALSDIVEAEPEPQRTPTASQQAAAERRVEKAQAELAEREELLRETQRLLQAGAASQAELREDTAARMVAAQELARAQSQAQSVASPAPSGARDNLDLQAARARLAHARREVAAARASLRAAQRERAPLVPARQVSRAADLEAGPRGSFRPARALGWREVSRPVAVRAPTSGIVSRVPLSPGRAVPRGNTLLWLTPGRRQTVSAVGPGRLRVLRPGAPARLQLSGSRAIRARLRAVEPLEGGQRVRVTAAALEALPEESGASPLRLELDLPAEQADVAVPELAVRRRETAPEVWIVSPAAAGSEKQGWIASRRPVRLGSRRNRVVTIRSGLPPDCRVIVAGMERLREGQEVAVVPWTLP